MLYIIWHEIAIANITKQSSSWWEKWRVLGRVIHGYTCSQSPLIDLINLHNRKVKNLHAVNLIWNVHDLSECTDVFENQSTTNRLCRQSYSQCSWSWHKISWKFHHLTDLILFLYMNRGNLLYHLSLLHRRLKVLGLKTQTRGQLS